MSRLATLLLLASAAARAQATALSAPAVNIEGVPSVAFHQPVTLVLDSTQCDPGLQPESWRDASDAFLFASGPLQQLSADGGEFQRLRSLAELRITLGSLRLFVLGAPAQSWGRLQLLPSSGWRLSNC
ncbi:MAG TPA: hypothetical protein VKH65_08785 [Myxococcales bacterium]|nr:hypothetical protein [Myxococcales bacterium]